MLTRVLLIAATAVLGAAALAYVATPASATTTCDRYASTTGNDAAAGTAAAPYRTAQKLADSLSAGQTGCLLGGVFTEDLRINHGGAVGSPIELTSAPGNRATLVGRLFIPDSSNDVVVSDLNLNGRNASTLPSPTVAGDRVTFRGNDVTNGHTGICFTLGSALGWGVAHDTVLDGNRIHDCGRLPATNHDHGIYVESSRNAVITDNYIFNNADRGIQLYPDAQGTRIANNLIDGNGEGVAFGGESGSASSTNTVSNNIIANSVGRANVESWWPAGNPVGSGNLVTSNCTWNGAGANIDLSGGGFTAVGNTIANPLFSSRSTQNFTLGAGSQCAGDGPVGGVVNPPPPAVAPGNSRLPSVSGTAKAGRTFTAATGSWSGTSPMTFSFSWLRCTSAGASCVATAKTAQSYPLTSTDVGHTLRVVVTAKNAAGSFAATSVQSAVVQSAKKQRGAHSYLVFRKHGHLRRAILRVRARH